MSETTFHFEILNLASYACYKFAWDIKNSFLPFFYHFLYNSSGKIFLFSPPFDIPYVQLIID